MFYMSAWLPSGILVSVRLIQVIVNNDCNKEWKNYFYYYEKKMLIDAEISISIL